MKDPPQAVAGANTTNGADQQSQSQQKATTSQPQQQQGNTLPPASLLTCSFNQDGGCLAIGTTSGFSVHNLHPHYSVSVERPLRGGIGLVEMLFRCNLMALVGGGPNPHGAPHRVLIWDDHLPKEIGELSFRQVVLQVKLRKDAIAVALRDRVYVYQLADLSLRDKIYTADNAHGLLTLSTHVSDMVLACPSVTPGQARVELYGLRKTVVRASVCVCVWLAGWLVDCGVVGLFVSGGEGRRRGLVKRWPVAF
jgi:WD repeat-containing protein 45